MTTRQTSDPRRVPRLVAATLAVVLAALAAVVGATPAPAQEPTPATGLTWKMSAHAFTSSSMAPAHTTTAPTTKVPDVGFVFPETSSVAYDPSTGSGRVTYPGGYELGNTNQGNYRIRVEDPTVVLAGDGTGHLDATVTYALTPPPSTPHTWSDPVVATVATFTLPDGALVDTGSQVSFTVTPDFVLRTDLDPNPNGWRQFPQPFLDALASSLRGHFQETGSGSADPNKPPAPLTVSFPYGPIEPGLTWKMSAHAFSSTSLAPAHATTPPATKTADGFVFPETSEVDYDVETGFGTIAYPGGYELGNTNQGNYRIRIADPIVRLEGDGTGHLDATVTYALTPPPSTPHTWSDPVDVTVATFAFGEGQPAVIGSNVSFTVTPDFVLRTDLDPNPNGWRQFPQPFLDALASSLRGHFQETGSGSADPNKPPAPLTVSFDLPAPPDPDEIFVHRAYDVVLGRGADEAGLAHWTAVLKAGGSRDAVGNALAGTGEARNRLVNEGYLRVLGRTADVSGRTYWAGRLAGGLAAEDLLAHLMASPEALGRAGVGSTDAAELLYQLYLGRAGDSAGVTYWAGRLDGAPNAGARRVIALGFGRTAEATAHGVRIAIFRACGITTVTGEQRADVSNRWVTSVRHPLRTAATALAIICSDEQPT